MYIHTITGGRHEAEISTRTEPAGHLGTASHARPFVCAEGDTMSYDISLLDPVTKATIEFDEPHQMAGGTYAVGGTREAWLNVTYNYAPIFRKVFGDENTELSKFEKIFGGGQTGIRRIYGMTGAQSIPVLETAIKQLGDDVSPDYWQATEGNAKRALCQLLALAKMRPDGIWDGG